MNAIKGILKHVTTWSKIITCVWLCSYVVVLIFSMVVTSLGLGDTLSIDYILRTVSELGAGIVPFYFCTKVIENVAEGIERFLGEQAMQQNMSSLSSPFNSDEKRPLDSEMPENEIEGDNNINGPSCFG